MVEVAGSVGSERGEGPPGGAAPSAFRDRGVSAFVWGAWALMLLADLLFVGTYGADVPFWDDYGYVSALVGERPVTLDWLWSPHNEHRVPLPRLILLVLYRLGGDFRAAMFFNVLVLGALAFAMIGTARRLRGRVSPTDAFFPLVLLHPGHCSNLLWSWQVGYVVPTALTGALLLAIVGGDAPRRSGSAIVAGICLVLLPLCGANGLLFVPAVAPWLVLIGVRRWRDGGPTGRRAAVAIVGLAAVALLLLPLYLHGLPRGDRSGGAGAGAGAGAILQSSVLFLGKGFGPPYSGPLEWCLPWVAAVWAVAIGVAGLLLLSAVVLVAIARGRPEERPRALGILAFLAGVAALAFGLGYGRTMLYVLPGRYTTLAVPALCCVYLVWSIYGPPSAGLLIRSALFAYSLAMVLFNFNYGISYGSYSKALMNAFERDLRGGVPRFVLSGRYTPLLEPRTDLLHDHLASLRRGGPEAFRRMREDPPFREVPIPLESADLCEMTLEGGAARSTGPAPALVVAVPTATFVGGIRLRYSHPGRGDALPEPFQVSWKKDGEADFPEDRYHLSSADGARRTMCAGTAEETLTVWLGDSAGHVRIRPDPEYGRPDASFALKPCEFRITEVTLLVPPEPAAVVGAGDGGGAGGVRPSRRSAAFMGDAHSPIRIRETFGVFARDVLSGVK